MKILQLLTKNANFTAAGYGVGSYVEHMKKAAKEGNWDNINLIMNSL